MVSFTSINERKLETTFRALQLQVLRQILQKALYFSKRHLRCSRKCSLLSRPPIPKNQSPNKFMRTSAPKLLGGVSAYLKKIRGPSSCEQSLFARANPWAGGRGGGFAWVGGFFEHPGNRHSLLASSEIRPHNELLQWPHLPIPGPMKVRGPETVMAQSAPRGKSRTGKTGFLL